MRSLFKYLGRIFLALTLLLVVLAIGLAIFSNTERFRQMVREQVIAAINSSMRGKITFDRIAGSIWGDVVLHDVRLRYRDEEIARVAQLKLAYALWPLLEGKLQITRAEAAKPVVRLVRNRQGVWIIAEALGSDTESQSQLTVHLKSLRLHNGDLDIRLEGDTPQRYRLKNLALASRLTIFPKGVDFDASEVSAQLQFGLRPELGLKGRLAFSDVNAPPTIKVAELRIDSAASRMKLSGELVGFDKSRVDAKLVVERLAPGDVERWVPDWPVRQVISGQLAAKGLFDALALSADLAAAGAKLKSQWTLNLTAPMPAYRGTIKVAGVDARALLGAKDFAGVLAGDANVKGAGFDLKNIAVDGDFAVRELQIKQWALGDLRSKLDLRDGAAALIGALKSGLGSADWRGQMTLAKVPRYDFDLSVSNLDIKKVSADAKLPGGVVSFKGNVQGSGVTLNELKAQAKLEILPSTLGAVQIRDGALDAAYGDGRIRIARAALRSADSSALIKGDIGTALDQRGKLDYEVRSDNITPWLALVGRKGAGAMTLAGTAQGTLADLSARGALKTTRLQFDGFGAASGAVDYELARQRGNNIPTGSVVARLVDARAGTELKKIDATIKLLAGDRAQVEAQVLDGFNRAHALKSEVDFSGQSSQEIVARVSQLSLGLPDGAWTLAQPATLTRRGELFSVDKLTLRQQERQATLQGSISLGGAQSLQLSVDRFPLESFAAYLPKQPKMTGLIALEAKVVGTAAAPQIDGQIKMTDSTIGGQKYDGLEAELNFRERLASLNLTVRQDRNHALTAVGTLPLRLSWQDGWRSELAGDLDLRIKSDGLSAAFLNAYTAKTVSDIGGELSLDVAARGAPLEPRWSGSLRFAGGKLKLTELNVEVRDVGLEASFDARRLTLENFTARANDGRLTGSGLLTLKQYQIDNFKFSLAARRWPAIQTRRYQAQIAGDVEISGPLAAPKLAGRVDITEANIRPDLAFLRQSSTPALRDETIVVVNREGSPRVDSAARNGNNNQLGETELFKKLVLDLDVRLPRNVWMRHPDAVVELRGAVRAKKNSGQKLQLVGASEIVRGWAAFQGRRFEFTRGEIQFVGGDKIDPQLDILAQHRLPQYTVNAIVGGTAENPSLVLRSDPALDQSDILSLLVFGKPIKDLNRGEQVSLQQSALDVTSGFAAAKIGSAVAEAIGLDNLGFDLGDFDFSNGRVGYGRYIGRRAYVTFSQEIAGERGQKASVQYDISRDWKIESSTTSKGSSSVDVIWHKRY